MRSVRDDSSMMVVGVVVLLKKSSRSGVNVSVNVMIVVTAKSHIFLLSIGFDLSKSTKKKAKSPSHAERENVTASNAIPDTNAVHAIQLILSLPSINAVVPARHIKTKPARIFGCGNVPYMRRKFPPS